MSSRKFSLELRLAVVQHYLSGKEGFREAATHFSVGRTALRRWVAAYELHGPDGLTWKTGQFSPEFRLSVVMAVIRDKLSLREATAKFNISGESTVYQWVKCYQTNGIDALLNLRQGRKKLEKDIPPPSITTDIPAEQLTDEQKRAEIRFLRAQVISERRHKHDLNALLRVAGMARSTLYYHLKAIRHAEKYQPIREEIT